MKKVELVEAVATKAGLTKADATRAIDAMLEAIEGALKGGDKVPLVGFGTFNVVNKPAAVKRNPRTGAPINVPARRKVTFKVGSQLNESVN